MGKLSRFIHFYTDEDDGNGGGGDFTRWTVTDPDGFIDFSTNVKKPMEMIVNFSPKQSGTGDPSPSNVRPITGYTFANINHTGVNMFGGNLLRDGVLAAMATATNDAVNRTVKFSSGATASQHITFESGLTGRFKPSTQYTFIMTLSKSSGTGTNLRVNYTDGTYSNVTALPSASKATTVLVSTANKTVLALTKYNGSGNTTLYYDESGVFEGVLTADDFVPYSGTTLPITFPSEVGTVYGGTLTIYENGTGKLESTKAYIASYNGETLNGEWISSMDVYASGTTPTTGAQVVHNLATPVTYNLTASQVQSLIGANNVWHDLKGDITVKYYEQT